ncbi:hypothetical protein TSOC_015240 [Tetrabaena socialis]|uniref:Uncharacterized protein n=1 Tax=Tetrabaena socialis TaxID=47790 RepID=A0A2J7ZFF0_9CHLO|nr:hypothetical protein TSOC_015240 [Tetrabaena socialis]|eukprot:PNG98990.1 hypothetical protein TSOC_015240 [Tetrabaena socialis]
MGPQGGASVWSGSVFVNPPFGMRDGHSLQGLFLARAAREFRAGRVVQVVLLLKAGVGYSWFREVYEWPHCFLFERQAFVRGERMPGRDAAEGAGAAGVRWGSSRLQNPHGSVVVYMGPHVARSCDVFARVGCVPGLGSWCAASAAAAATAAAEGGAAAGTAHTVVH